MGDPIFYLRAQPDRMQPMNQRAQLALDHLLGIGSELEDLSVHLMAGDFLVLDNLRVLHRRSEMQPSEFSCTSRLLMRAYAASAASIVPEERIYLVEDANDRKSLSSCASLKSFASCTTASPSSSAGRASWNSHDDHSFTVPTEDDMPLIFAVENEGDS